MNTLVIVLLAAVVLFAAYVLYGRWLANKWGIDPKAKTPAVQKNPLLPKLLAGDNVTRSLLPSRRTDGFLETVLRGSRVLFIAVTR